MAASSGVGGRSSEPPAQTAPSAREVLRRLVAGSCERVDAPAFLACDLRDEVSGGAEAVKAEVAGVVAGSAQAAPADQAGAQQRRGMHRVVGEARRVQAERDIGDHMRREAAVAAVAGESGRVAKILLLVSTPGSGQNWGAI